MTRPLWDARRQAQLDMSGELRAFGDMLDEVFAAIDNCIARLEALDQPYGTTKPRNRENVMLTRRAFTGVMSCAICAVASEFMATEAEAQAAPPAATAGVTRKILSQSDGPAAGYETLLWKPQ